MQRRHPLHEPGRGRALLLSLRTQLGPASEQEVQGPPRRRPPRVQRVQEGVSAAGDAPPCPSLHPVSRGVLARTPEGDEEGAQGEGHLPRCVLSRPEECRVRGPPGPARECPRPAARRDAKEPGERPLLRRGGRGGAAREPRAGGRAPGERTRHFSPPFHSRAERTTITSPRPWPRS